MSSETKLNNAGPALEIAPGSLAIGQRSLGDPSRLFPLTPVIVDGCPASSGEAMQYPLEIDYDYDAVDRRLFEQAPGPGLDRWAPLLPPLAKGLSMGEGGTPLIAAEAFGRSIGIAGNLYLKDESRNPTWSHKDRLNLCVVSAAIASGARGIAVASSGNHGAAAAAYAARAGLPCVVVTSGGMPPAFRDFLMSLGARVVVTPEDRRWPVLRRIVNETGFMPASNLTRFHTGNPYGPEGYKTIAYELFLQLDHTVPDHILAPTGYGEMLFGVWKGFQELKRLGLVDRLPTIYACEPAIRGPLRRAVSSNAAAAEVSGPASIAVGIACAVSSYRGAVAIESRADRALPASETEIAAMRARLAATGLYQEFSGVAGLAAASEATSRGLVLDGKVVAIMTSSGLKDVTPTGAEIYGEDTLDGLIDTLREGTGDGA
ncbi:threonine synthase [Martelella alba]|uniref:threonine synthase n=1 Tax=Martelella alba TaxID=2590451 RepID=UPI001AED35D8|nr:pyridoxal-phosphate dependent enzyme [Martelella alba]